MIEKEICYDVTNQPLEDINNFCINNEVELVIQQKQSYIILFTISQSLHHYLGVERAI